MKSIEKIIGIIAAVVATFIIGARAAAFSVSPMLIEAEAEAGKSYTGVLTVFGDDHKTEFVRLYIVDWDKLPSGEDMELMAGILERSCSLWVTLSESQLEVPAKGAVSVKYSFTVPDGTAGSYWTFIMVEGEKAPEKPVREDDKVQFMVNTQFRYAVRLFVNVGRRGAMQGKINRVEIGRPAEKGPFKDAPLATKVVFENYGDFLLKPQGYVEIRNMDGEVVVRTEVPPRFYVIPGHERWIEAPIDKQLADGDYLALAVLDFGGESLVAGEAQFSIPIQPEDSVAARGSENAQK